MPFSGGANDPDADQEAATSTAVAPSSSDAAPAAVDSSAPPAWRDIQASDDYRKLPAAQGVQVFQNWVKDTQSYLDKTPAQTPQDQALLKKTQQQYDQYIQSTATKDFGMGIPQDENGKPLTYAKQTAVLGNSPAATPMPDTVSDPNLPVMVRQPNANLEARISRGYVPAPGEMNNVEPESQAAAGALASGISHLITVPGGVAASAWDYMTGTPPGTTALDKGMNVVQQFQRNVAAENPGGVSGTLGQSIPEGAGNLAATMASSGGLGWVGMGIFAGTDASEEVYHSAINEGATPTQAAAAAGTAAAVTGITFRLMGPAAEKAAEAAFGDNADLFLKGLYRPTTEEAVKYMSYDAAAQGALGAGGQVVQNVEAEKTYDPDRKWYEGAGNAALQQSFFSLVHLPTLLQSFAGASDQLTAAKGFVAQAQDNLDLATKSGNAEAIQKAQANVAQAQSNYGRIIEINTKGAPQPNMGEIQDSQAMLTGEKPVPGINALDDLNSDLEKAVTAPATDEETPAPATPVEEDDSSVNKDANVLDDENPTSEPLTHEDTGATSDESTVRDDTETDRPGSRGGESDDASAPKETGAGASPGDSGERPVDAQQPGTGEPAGGKSAGGNEVPAEPGTGPDAQVKEGARGESATDTTAGGGTGPGRGSAEPGQRPRAGSLTDPFFPKADTKSPENKAAAKRARVQIGDDGGLTSEGATFHDKDGNKAVVKPTSNGKWQALFTDAQGRKRATPITYKSLEGAIDGVTGRGHRYFGKAEAALEGDPNAGKALKKLSNDQLEAVAGSNSKLSNDAATEIIRRNRKLAKTPVAGEAEAPQENTQTSSPQVESELPGLSQEEVSEATINDPKAEEAASTLKTAFGAMEDFLKKLGFKTDKIFRNNGDIAHTGGAALNLADRGRIQVDLKTLGDSLSRLSPSERLPWMTRLLQHEGIHEGIEQVAEKIIKEVQSANRKGEESVPRLKDVNALFEHIWNALSPEQQTLAKNTYGGEDSGWNHPDFIDAIKGREYIRMLAELAMDGRTTEATDMLTPEARSFFQKLVDYLKELFGLQEPNQPQYRSQILAEPKGDLADHFEKGVVSDLIDRFQQMAGKEAPENSETVGMTPEWKEFLKNNPEFAAGAKPELKTTETDLKGKYGAWVDRSGKIIPVYGDNAYGHENVADKHLKELNDLSAEETKTNGWEGPGQVLFKRGYVRVHSGRVQISSESHESLTFAQRKVLKQMGEDTDRDVYHYNSLGKDTRGELLHEQNSPFYTGVAKPSIADRDHGIAAASDYLQRRANQRRIFEQAHEAVRPFIDKALVLGEKVYQTIKTKAEWLHAMAKQLGLTPTQLVQNDLYLPQIFDHIASRVRGDGEARVPAAHEADMLTDRYLQERGIAHESSPYDPVESGLTPAEKTQQLAKTERLVNAGRRDGQSRFVFADQAGRDAKIYIKPDGSATLGLSGSRFWENKKPFPDAASAISYLSDLGFEIQGSKLAKAADNAEATQRTSDLVSAGQQLGQRKFQFEHPDGRQVGLNARKDGSYSVQGLGQLKEFGTPEAAVSHLGDRGFKINSDALEKKLVNEGLHPEQQTTKPTGAAEDDEMHQSVIPAAKPLSQKLEEARTFGKDLFNEFNKIPKFTSVLRSLGLFDAERQRNSQMIENSVKQFQKEVPSELRREAITNYNEARNNPGELLKRAAMTTDPKLKAGYEAAMNLTPTEKAWADRIYKNQQLLRAGAVKYGMQIGEVENYMTHLWERESMDRWTGMLGRSLSKTFKFAKERKYATYFEGEQAGLTPKTKDASVLWGTYAQELSNVISARRLVENLAKGGPMPDGMPVVAPGNKGQWVNIENPKGKVRLINQPMAEGAFSHYLSLDLPAFTKWYYEGQSGGRKIYAQGDMYIHPMAYARLKNAFSNSKIREFWAMPTDSPTIKMAQVVSKFVLDDVRKWTKGTLFGGFPLFHIAQEATGAVGYKVNPFAAIRGQAPDLNDPQYSYMTKMGVELHPSSIAMSNYMEGNKTSHSLLLKALENIPGVREMGGKYLADTANAMTEWTFKNFIPKLKASTFIKIHASNTKTYAKELASGQVTPDDIGYLSALQTNSAYGGLNQMMLPTSKSATILHAFSMIGLAPDFWEARVRHAGAAAVGIATIPIGSAKSVRAQMNSVLVLGGSTYIAARILNSYLNNGDPMMDAKHAFSIVYDGRAYQMRSYISDALEAVTNFQGYLSGRLSPVSRSLWEAYSGVNYRGEEVKGWNRFVTDPISGMMPIPLQPFTRDLSSTGKNQPISIFEQMLGSIGIKVSRFAPAQQIYPLAKTWMDQQGLNTPRGVYPTSEYTPLKYALEDGDYETGNKLYEQLVTQNKGNVGKVTKGILASINRPFTESQASDQQFRASLTPENQKLFDAAVTRRQLLMQRFQQMRSEAKPHGT